MSPRKPAEVAASVILAFLDERTWTQADLARHLKLGVPAVKKQLESLRQAGMPLQREEERPHVYWSCPRDWFPSGIVFADDELADLVRVIRRAPADTTRERVLRKLIRQAGVRDDGGVIPPSRAPEHEGALRLLEDSMHGRFPIDVHYFSTRLGIDRWHRFSVQRIHEGQRVRAVVFDHEARALRFVRLEGVMGARRAEGAAFEGRDAGEVDAFERGAVDGFRAGDGTVKSVFTVKDPDARWVERNLPHGGEWMVTRQADGVRVEITGDAVIPIARFVVGLGGAAAVETRELREAVRALAEGALQVR